MNTSTIDPTTAAPRFPRWVPVTVYHNWDARTGLDFEPWNRIVPVLRAKQPDHGLDHHAICRELFLTLGTAARPVPPELSDLADMYRRSGNRALTRADVISIGAEPVFYTLGAFDWEKIPTSPTIIHLGTGGTFPLPK